MDEFIKNTFNWMQTISPWWAVLVALVLTGLSFAFSEALKEWSTLFSLVFLIISILSMFVFLAGSCVCVINAIYS